MSRKRHLIHDFRSLTSLLVMTTPSLALPGRFTPFLSPPPHHLLTVLPVVRLASSESVCFHRSRCVALPSQVLLTRGVTPTVRHRAKPEERAGPLPAQLTGLTSKQQLAATAIDSYSRV